MGMGDDMLFLGEAEKMHNQTGKMIRPVLGRGWSPLYKNVSFLTKDKTSDSISLNERDVPGVCDRRVQYYTKEKRMTILGEEVIFQPYNAKPFQLRFTEEELQQADNLITKYKIPKDFCTINPDYKSAFFSGNKNWGFKKYQELCWRMDMPVVRIRPGGAYTEPPLKNAIDFECNDVRVAFAVLTQAKFGVTFMGLMVHVLAGFGVPCVVIHGGLSSEKIMKYKGQQDLEYEHPDTPCGRTYDCWHCKEGNKSITVDMVYDAIQRIHL